LNRLLRPALAALVFLLALALRIDGIGRDFYLLGDQMRDWSIAMRSFADLPLVGPPTHVGGYTIGPAFYWILWLIRLALGPFFDNLPHAGGIGQAALQSGADALLFYAIWRRIGQPWIALATIVFIATASFDLNLAALVWNPTMGTALAKIAVAWVLLDWHRRSAIHAGVMAAVAWASVHAYTGAIFVVIGVFAAITLDPIVKRDRAMAARNAVAIVAAVILLQLPYAAHQLLYGFRDRAMSAPIGSAASVLTGERPPEIAKSVAGFLEAVRGIQLAPWNVGGFGWILLACAAIVAVRHVRDPALLCVTLVPQAVAIAGYSLFLAGLDNYYYLSLMPSIVLTVTLVAAAVPSPRLSHAAGVAMLLLALAIVPARLRYERALPRLPEYELLVDASRKIRNMRQPMRAIETDFNLPPTGDPAYLFSLLGGQIDRHSRWVATIHADGRVDYRQIAEP
jgi:hypothetical protein